MQTDTPASHAGLEPGDVITSVNGQTVKNPRDLAVDVAAVQPGDEAKLEVMHNGESKTISVKVGQLPNEQMASTDGHPAVAGADRPGAGAAVAGPARPARRAEGHEGRRWCARWQPGSPAEQAGLQAGDVIVGVGDKQVASPSEAASAIRGASKDHAVALRIIRNGQPLFVGVNLDQSSEG